MRSKCVKNGFRGSKMTSEVARRRRRAALESSEATKEALGGSRTAFRRLNGAVQGDRGGPRRLQDGILEAQGRWSTRDVREMREVRRDVRGPLSSIWTKSDWSFTRYAPLQAGGGGFKRSAHSAVPSRCYVTLCYGTVCYVMLTPPLINKPFPPPPSAR